MANFSNLPYFDCSENINAGTAYLSEDIVTRPFVDDFMLQPGVHLHWLLPDALRRSADQRGDKDKQLAFPAAPNLWQMTRVIDGDHERAKS